MFDLSWGEMAFLAVLALIVVGPKDLPRLAHGAGKLMARGQRIYRDSMFNLRRLETEIEQARATDVDGRPAFHALLPEHVQQHLADSVAPKSATKSSAVADTPS